MAIDARDLLNLRAVIFAASRSLGESRAALKRQPSDLLTVWGVGVHPGVKGALDSYDSEVFGQLLSETAYVGEVGLDAKVPSRLSQQRDVFASVLAQLQVRPRLTSIHSYGATVEVVDQLERTPVTGAILHWWLGDRASTTRALDLGAWFSVNAATLRRSNALDIIPIDRLLLETDHPDGNRGGGQPRQPGNVSDVEARLAASRGITSDALRLQLWQNLAALVAGTGTRDLLPSRVRAIVDAT
ncbi:TatD family hydrolase [Nonomuraea sp. NPDC052129]|uniref:TatD family hydrolase n=1 Tax=Nonomuraea sp. NPDC052129 TaxID=3154651 RepID=UPI0034127D68